MHLGMGAWVGRKTTQSLCMEAKMDGAVGQNQENFSVVRGDRYAERPARIFTAAELELDSDMQEIVGAVRGANGKPPTRGFARQVYGDGPFPWRVLARWFVAARRKRAPKSQLVAALARLNRFLDRLYENDIDLAA